MNATANSDRKFSLPKNAELGVRIVFQQNYAKSLGAHTVKSGLYSENYVSCRLVHFCSNVALMETRRRINRFPEFLIINQNNKGNY